MKLRPQQVAVLMSPGRATSNPFVELFVESLPEDILVIPFSWRRALGERYSVMHVHWPEAIFRGSTAARQLLKLAALLIVVVRNRLLGIAHVETVHNLTPHESLSAGPLRLRLERLTLLLWTASCTTRVYLTPVGCPSDARSVVIPHGDYRQIVGPGDREVAARNSFLIFGRLRPYKGIEEFLSSFADATVMRNASLTVAGLPSNDEYAGALRARVPDSPNVTMRFERLSDAELVTELRRHEFAVLPYRSIYNSGAALLALTVGVPIIATDSPTMRELRAEYGSEWVELISFPPVGDDIARAATALRSRSRGEPPRPQHRDWSTIGGNYAAIYRSRGIANDSKH